MNGPSCLLGTRLDSKPLPLQGHWQHSAHTQVDAAAGSPSLSWALAGASHGGDRSCSRSCTQSAAPAQAHSELGSRARILTEHVVERVAGEQQGSGCQQTRRSARAHPPPGWSDTAPFTLPAAHDLGLTFPPSLTMRGTSEWEHVLIRNDGWVGDFPNKMRTFMSYHCLSLILSILYFHSNWE